MSIKIYRSSIANIIQYQGNLLYVNFWHICGNYIVYFFRWLNLKKQSGLDNVVKVNLKSKLKYVSIDLCTM